MCERTKVGGIAGYSGWFPSAAYDADLTFLDSTSGSYEDEDDEDDVEKEVMDERREGILNRAEDLDDGFGEDLEAVELEVDGTREGMTGDPPKP